MFNAQELNHKIVIEHQVTTTDGYGGTVTTWETFAEPFCKVEPTVGKELFAAQTVYSKQPVKFTTRFIDGLDTTMRISYDGRTFDIQSVNDIKGMRRETLIYATASE
jgi:SPP1 family predicted phage head-tail adaptor